VAEAFESIGYTSEKVHYLVNRADSSGGMSRDELARRSVEGPISRWSRTAGWVVQANNEGMRSLSPVPTLAVSRDIRRAAAASPDAPGRRAPVETLRSCPTLVQSASSTQVLAA